MYEGLDFELLPRSDLTPRIRIVPRTIFSLCYAQYHGYTVDLDIAIRLAQYLKTYHYDSTRGYVSKADDLSSPLYTYDHAFILLAQAWLYLVTKNSAYKDALLYTTTLMDRNLRAPDGSFLVTDKDSDSAHRDQNPHMHLLEACMQAYLITGDSLFKEWSKNIFSLFEKNFIHAFTVKSDTYLVLLEFMNDSWHPRKSMEISIEPGHHFEWIWLLESYYRIIDQSPRIAELMSALFTTACTFGLSADGLGYDGLELHISQKHESVEASDNPSSTYSLETRSVPRQKTKPQTAHVHIKTPTHRLWVQTEHLKALMVRERSPNTNTSRDMPSNPANSKIPNSEIKKPSSFEQPKTTKKPNTTKKTNNSITHNAHDVLETIASRYLLPQKGIWYDRIDKYGNVSHYCPSSMLYHVLIAMQEAIHTLL